MSPPPGYKHFSESDKAAIRQLYEEDREAKGVKFGECFCGCGGVTLPATRNRRRDAGEGLTRLKGFPLRYLHNHEKRSSPVDYIEEDHGFATLCWIWQLNTDREGYGRKWIEGRSVRAHRWHYELAFGPIPDGMVPDHLCKQTSCVNPDHLEAVTSAVNARRSDGTILKPWQVRAIRRAHEEAELSPTQLSRVFGVSFGAIAGILSRKNWKELV